MKRKDKKERQGKGIYFCPRCHGKYKNSKWRQKQEARRKCQNDHKETEMLWFSSMAVLMNKMYVHHTGR